VLEVGFGSGVTFPTLSQRYREIWGLDLGAPVNEIMDSFRGMGIETHLKNGSVLDTGYPDGWFDTVLLVSILEHLKPTEQAHAFSELKRIIKPGAQVVYGVPVERGLMVFTFRMMGIDIREHHFSTELDVAKAAGSILSPVSRRQLSLPVLGAVYEVGHYVKPSERHDGR
jgi:SAM-dependent methyltransferase